MLVFMLFLCSAESFHYIVVFRVLMKHIKRTRWCFKPKKNYWPAPSLGAWLNTFCLASIFLPALSSHVSSHINAHSVDYFVLCGVHAPLYRTASHIIAHSVHSVDYFVLCLWCTFSTVPDGENLLKQGQLCNSQEGKKLFGFNIPPCSQAPSLFIADYSTQW